MVVGGLMNIAIKKNIVQLFMEENSMNLRALLYFIENTFENIQFSPGKVIISHSKKEIIKRRYLLRWAFKLYQKNSLQYLSYKLLLRSDDLPIQIIIQNDKKTTKQFSLKKSIRITVEQITANELSVNVSEYNQQVINYFKHYFKNAMVLNVNKYTFMLTITKDSEIALLKRIFSRREILGISIKFVTVGLNYKQMHEYKNEELKYQEKFQKACKILNLSGKLESHEIKSNYKSMLRKYHPDKVHNESQDTINLYTKRFQIVQEAYRFIKEHQQIA